MHHNVLSHSFIDKRFAKIDKHVEDSWVVDNMDPDEEKMYTYLIFPSLCLALPSHPNWESSCQEITKTSQFIDTKVPEMLKFSIVLTLKFSNFY